MEESFKHKTSPYIIVNITCFWWVNY